MGSLQHFLLDKFIDQYNTQYFIETGTGSGDGLVYAAKFPFCKLYSVEIHDELCEEVKKKFADNDRVTLINAKSEPALDILLQILPQNVPALFWLDAHFPGAHCSKMPYDAIKDADIRLPLERELSLIFKRRPGLRDIILIDDLRIYEEGEYAKGNMPDSFKDALPEKRDIKFIENMFGKSHFITRDFADDGYLLITPR